MSAPGCERDVVTDAGLTLVAVAAAVLSFAGLAALAYMCGLDGVVEIGPFRFYLAWLFPLAIDVFAITATRVWILRKGTPETVTVAMWSAIAAVVTTIGGNGYHGWLVDAGTRPPWFAAVLVGAAPAVALAGLAHLAMLVRRDRAARPAHQAGRSPWDAVVDDALADEWTRAITAWAARRDQRANAGGPSARPAPDRGASDAVLAADLRATDAARWAEGLAPLSRDGIRDRYGVGGTRASRLREYADAAHQAEPGDADEPEPAPAAHELPADDELVPAAGGPGGGGRT